MKKTIFLVLSLLVSVSALSTSIMPAMTVSFKGPAARELAQAGFPGCYEEDIMLYTENGCIKESICVFDNMSWLTAEKASRDELLIVRGEKAHEMQMMLENPYDIHCFDTNRGRTDTHIMVQKFTCVLSVKSLFK